MKRTFRFLTMGLLAVGLLASCNKKENNNGGTADGLGFKAITEQSGNSKTHGVLNDDGTQMEVRWTTSDQIKVNNGNETSTFQLTSGENTTTGEFYTTNSSSFDLTSSDFTAIYPAANADGVENTVSGNTATFNLPATQSFDADHAGSFAEKAMPMVAHSGDQTLHFKNVLGGICFPLVGYNMNVTRIVLTSNVDEALWGTCTTSIDADGYPTNTVVNNSEANKNVITIDCGTGVALDAANATEFTVMVPPATLASGFTIAIYDGNNKLDEKSTTNNPNITRSEISVVNKKLAVRGFSVGENNYIWFSTGNLQYIGSATPEYWSFAQNQWDYLGSANGTAMIKVDRDLFGWGTSGYHNPDDEYNTEYLPYHYRNTTVNTTYNQYGYGPSSNMTDLSLVGTSANYDWGIFNDIYNPSTGNTDVAGTWRTLSSEEWYYLKYTRANYDLLNGMGSVNGVNGFIWLPDNWTLPAGLTFTSGDSNWANVYTAEQWAVMEAAGAVFLPAAGCRNVITVSGENTTGLYWASTNHVGGNNGTYAKYLSFGIDSTGSPFSFTHYVGERHRYLGFSVRLVCPAN